MFSFSNISEIDWMNMFPKKFISETSWKHIKPEMSDPFYLKILKKFFVITTSVVNGTYKIGPSLKRFFDRNKDLHDTMNSSDIIFAASNSLENLITDFEMKKMPGTTSYYSTAIGILTVAIILLNDRIEKNSRGESGFSIASSIHSLIFLLTGLIYRLPKEKNKSR